MLRIVPYLYLPVTDMPGDFEVWLSCVPSYLDSYGLLQSEKHSQHSGSTVIPKMLMQRPLCNVYHVLIISASFNISDWRLALYLEQKKYDTMPSGA